MKQARSAPAGVMTGAHKWFTGLLTLTAATLAILVNARNLGFTPWLGVVNLNYADQAARRIVITPRTDTMHALGDTTALGAIVTDANGSALVGATLRWRSLDSSVATVDSGGTVVARAPGRTQIECSVREVTGRAVIHVIQQPVRVVIAGDSAVRILDGDSARLFAQVVDGRDRGVLGAAPRWQSGDSSIVTVDSTGTARALSSGRAYIWAVAGDLKSRVRMDVALKPAALVLQSGEGQRAVAGRRLPDPVVVQVRSRGGLPVPGAAVTVAADDEHGVAEPTSDTADADGRVRIAWTLSPQAGVQRLTARVAGVDSALRVSAEAEPVPGNVRIEVVNPEFKGPVSRELPEPVVVRVTDSAGLALSLVRIGWVAVDGGTITGPGRTDSSGSAQAYWTLGPRAGRQRLRVQVGNPRLIPATEVKAVAEPGAATAIVLVSGASQRATAGAVLPKAVVVKATDSAGNAVPGARVTIAAHGGAVDDSVVTTGADGRATLRWTLGPKTGEQQLTLKLAGTKVSTTTSATAKPGPAAKLALTARSSGTKGALRVTATVTDELGNAIPAAPLTLAATGGTLSATRVKSDTAGHAAVTWSPAVAVPAKSDLKITARVTGTKVTGAHTVKAGSGAQP
jgi:hypothetical protein